MNSRFAPTRQHPQPDLNHINDRKHQEQTTNDRPNSRGHRTPPQDFQVDMCPKGLVNVLAVQQVYGQFESLSDQRREEEEAEGDHLEDQQLLGHVNAGVTGVRVLEAVLTWGCQ